MRQGVAMALIVALGIVGGSAIGEIGQADAGPRQEQKMLNLAQQQLNELKRIKESVRNVSQQIGTTPLRGLRAEIAAIKSAAESTNSTLGAPFGSVRSEIEDNQDLLKDICRAVRPSIAGYPCL